MGLSQKRFSGGDRTYFAQEYTGQSIRYKILILVAVERYAYQDLFMKELDLVKLVDN